MSFDPYGVLVVERSTTGTAFVGRHIIRKVMVMHSAGSDANVKFYDLATAPVGGEPHYTINAYGKGLTQIDMPNPGVEFYEGMYVDLPASCIITVWYEAV
jgi:hypothetical protein